MQILPIKPLVKKEGLEQGSALLGAHPEGVVGVDVKCAAHILALFFRRVQSRDTVGSAQSSMSEASTLQAGAQHHYKCNCTSQETEQLPVTTALSSNHKGSSHTLYSHASQPSWGPTAATISSSNSSLSQGSKVPREGVPMVIFIADVCFLYAAE